MYVTGILAGRPYQSYVPRPLLPPIDARHVDLFRKLDKRFLGSLDADRFTELAIEVVVQPRNKTRPSEPLQHARSAVAAHLCKDSIGVPQIKKINASLTASASAAGPQFRDRFAWIGAPHPGLSWHVGSPPEMLQPLVKNLLQAKTNDMPASLWAVLAMLRLLQIHPFLDGNGRTARLYAVWVLRKFIGPSIEGARMIDRLWDRKSTDLNSLSLQTQSSGRFDCIFEHIREGYADD